MAQHHENEEANIIDSLRRTRLRPTIAIQNLITLFYFEFGKDYVFAGEKHNFWELLYVDRGEVEVSADETRHVLKQGSIIFHKPNEYHRFHSAQGIAPNVIVITFDCASPAMDRFAGKVLQLDDEERNGLVRILNEGRNAFSFPFEHPLRRLDNPEIGSEQLLKCYLEIFLIGLLRRMDRPSHPPLPLSTPAKEKNDEDLVRRVIRYLEERPAETLRLDELSSAFFLSAPRLQSLFKKHTGLTIKQYAIRLKIRQAKIYIREERFNHTEISRMLGFTSVHYFSRFFKKEAGMSPSEYARSVKVRSERPQ